MQIGIDIGGSHIGAGLVNENGKIIIKKECNLCDDFKDKENRKQEIRDIVISLIRNILQEVGAPKCVIKKIGIACPGKIKNGVAYDLYNLNLKSLELKSELEEYYKTNVTIHNDAKCAGIAEKKYGSLQKYEDCVFLCLGTGIGGATFLNNEMLIPKKNEGFEYGHMIIEKSGRQCRCGNCGCFEKYASMSAFKQGFISEVLENKEEYMFFTSEQILSYILENRNEPKIQNYIDEYIDNLILGICNICKVMEPQAISLGGSFVHFHKVLYTRLIEKLNEHNYKFDVPDIVLATLGNDAGIIGAVC